MDVATASVLHGSTVAATSSSQQSVNPFAKDSFITQVGEHIPLLNQAFQEIHKVQGDTAAYHRARARNPVGADGVVTQACEHIPLVCDGIEALHRINGQHSAAERASARSLPRLLSKDG